MNLHDLIGYLVHRTDVKMTNYFTKKLKPFGVTPEQWGIISVLCSQRATTQKELAEAILPVVTDAHHFVTSNLSEEEIKVLQSLLNKLYDTRY